MMDKKKAEELMFRFDNQFENKEQEERKQLFKTLDELVTEHGYDAVSFTTGYRVSTLNTMLRGNIQNISKQRIERAVFVFNSLTSE